jgi:hypothetical protein
VACAINPSAGDIAAAISVLGGKGTATAGHSEWSLWLAAGVPTFTVYYGGGTANFERATASGAITAGRHVITVTFDPTAGFGARCKLYVDGVFVAQVQSSGGVNGTISDLVDILRSGAWGGFPPVSRMSYLYGWADPQLVATILTNYNWIKTVKGWT